MTNRVHIDAPAGVVEIEGEKDFVEGLLAKLFPLLENVGFGSRPPDSSNADSVRSGSSGSSDEEDAEEEVNGRRSKAKRKRNVAPKGHSCADRILSLKEEGFFKTKRSGGDIVAGLAEKGYTHKSNQVAAAGESLFTRGLLQRTKEGSGPFKYYWDRE